VDSGTYDSRTALRCETGAADLDWLNRLIAIGIGARLPWAVELRVLLRDVGERATVKALR
jgi:hypothetical protein